MRLLSTVAAMSLLAACGGSGGNPTPAPPPPPPATNAPPTIGSGATAQITENGTAAYTLQASDPDGDPLTLSISGGADANLFSISQTGTLSFNTPPNFERAGDADEDNVYEVDLRASDGAAQATISVAITVNNSREGIAVRRLATGFNQPTFIEPIPASDEFFVIEKGGRIYIFNPGTGQRTLFRTLNNISTAGEGGLLGIAVGDDFRTNNFFYVFVSNQAGDIEIRQLRGSNLNGLGPLAIAHPGFSNHYGGWIDFGPDGNLYISTGDGGGAGDPDDNAQDVNSRLGKILRIGVNPDPFAGASVPSVFYIIPPDNPFANGGGAPEIFALGLRNPFRASFYDDGLLIGDVGQNSLEEVDRLAFDGGGTNFGWPFREGTEDFRGNAPAGLTDPVTEYSQGNGPRQGASVIGGVVYDGPIADLNGDYIFGDFISGNIWSVPLDTLLGGGTVDASAYEARNVDFTPDQGMIDNIVAFEMDDAGNLYIVDFDGDIFVVEQDPTAVLANFSPFG